MSLRCEAVRASYNGREVLAGVDLAVQPGEWVAVVGPNGSGKSTLLRRIAGIVAGHGSVSVEGQDPGSVSRREAARLVALVPQNPVVPDGISVLDYVGLGRTPHVGSWSLRAPEESPAVRRVLRELDLGDLAHRALSTLSGGEFQRAVLGRALAQETAVLLLDEPTTALDLGHAQEVMELVDGRCRQDGIAVLSAMHDLTLAAQFCDRLMLLADGVIAAEGSAREVITRELLASYFEAEVVILDGPGGEPVVVPRSR
ncbi:MAG: ABC transporter ATP-binding protein [Acidimicrobiia bacterium]